MSENLKNISQLAQICNMDRATVRKALCNLHPHTENAKEKLYFAPVAIAILLDANANHWKEFITNLLNEKVLQINK